MSEQHYRDRYLFSDWSALCRRVADAVGVGADADTVESFYDIMYSKTFMPAGNTLLAGERLIAPNCSILGTLTDDNFDDMLALSCKLWRQGTGIGYDLSGLSRPVEALHRLSDANDAIELGHRPKRGNMAVLSADHADIMQFIHCKSTDGTLYNFNISVVYSDSSPPDVLDAAVRRAHATGDPGLVFIEHARRYGPTDASAELGDITTCVPCGEQFMHAYETCNLGSVNLNSDALMDAAGRLDRTKLRRAVRIGVDILDRVIDLLVFPDENLSEVSLAARRIGLGVTGWADYLARAGLSYDSDAARALASELSRFISATAEQRSRERAVEYGPCTFSTEYRNLSMTCIAPTGGITGLMGLRGYAIEPFFDEATRLDYRAHIDMQAAWQSGMHNAVSKTVNMPAGCSAGDVRDAYSYAQKRGCKGITIYRDRSKDDQPRVLACRECEV